MPYVPSEGVILYSLHRGACSRGLQARRERELVLGLYGERCGLLEMLISGSAEECAYYRALCVVRPCVCVCVCESVPLCVRLSVSVFVSLETAPVTPFYS